MIEKNDRRKSNPKTSHTTKVSKHIPWGFSMPAISSSRNIDKKSWCIRNKDCIKRVCEYLREHAMKIISFKKKKMKLWTKEQQVSYVIFVKKNLKTSIWKIKKCHEVRDHCYYTGQYGGLHITNVI